MKTVLIIDDSPIQLKLFREYLHKYFPGATVIFARDGMDLFPLYEHHRPDLVIIDLHMPQKDGDIAALELLEAYPAATILISSAADSREDFKKITAVMLQGVTGYLLKPIDPDDLVKTLKDI
ncbi:MAG: response regulator [Fibrobacterota bacterium]